MPTSQYQNLDQAIAELGAGKLAWAQTSPMARIKTLKEIKDCLMAVSRDWAETAARKKLMPAGSVLVGEEWMSGSLPVMMACNALMVTLSGMAGKTFLNKLPSRITVSGQTAVRVIPHSIWDHLLLSGITAEVWMQKGITDVNLAAHTAGAYDTPKDQRGGKIALVLGAGNIAAIAPLDAFQKLFSENQVVLLKLNPVNDYLMPFLNAALKPLIDLDALRIVKGGAEMGGYLCNHPDIEEIHITGAGETHDMIVWGAGAVGAKNKKAGTPKLDKPITSELGAVCPTIVVPGPWSAADLKFQADHIATQKMHNSGFNCVACQMLILPSKWDKVKTLMNKVEQAIRTAEPRLAYYPGALGRMDDFAGHGGTVVKLDRGAAPACVLVSHIDGADPWVCENEVFAPAFATYEIAEDDPEVYLRQAIKYANNKLYGTLGGSIIIHPKTMRAIGKKRFEEIIAEFQYGTIGINVWAGLGFLLPSCPWGAFPGHSLDNVQSGIGFVHNTFMFNRVERTVITAPFRPFPRNLFSGGMTLLPKPPWFITNKKQDKIGALLTDFQHRPGWLKIPRIFLNALLG